MTDAPVLFDVRDRIATITLNRPEVRNALSSEVLRLLPQLMMQADGDVDVDVIILTGADPAFCAGLDLKELGSTGGNLGGGSGSDGGANAHGGRGPFPKVSKPLIGAVNGVAVTGGLELALNCDFLVASERAKFGDTHARVGVMPGWGMTVLLPQAIGVRRAREMSFTGNFLGAEEALQFGLVNHVVPHDELLPFTRALAADIAGNEAERRAPDPGDVRRDRARRRRVGEGGSRLRGRGIARCSAPRRSPNGGPRSSAAAEVSDPLAGRRPRAATGGGAPSPRRERAVIGGVALGALVLTAAASPYRSIATVTPRATTSPCTSARPGACSTATSATSSPTTGSPCSTRTGASARTRIHGAGRCCCHRSSTCWGLDYDRLKLRRGRHVLRLARARPRHRAPAHRADARARRHRGDRHSARSCWPTPTNCCRSSRPRQRSRCSSGGAIASGARPTDRSGAEATWSVLGALAAVAFNVRREAIVLVVVIGVIQLVELAGLSAAGALRGTSRPVPWRASPPPTSRSPCRRCLLQLLLPSMLFPDNGDHARYIGARLGDYPRVTSPSSSVSVAPRDRRDHLGVSRPSAMVIGCAAPSRARRTARRAHHLERPRHQHPLPDGGSLLLPDPAVGGLLHGRRGPTRPSSLVLRERPRPAAGAPRLAVVPLLYLVVVHAAVLPGDIADARDFNRGGRQQVGPTHPGRRPRSSTSSRGTPVPTTWSPTSAPGR